MSETWKASAIPFLSCNPVEQENLPVVTAVSAACGELMEATSSVVSVFCGLSEYDCGVGELVTGPSAQNCAAIPSFAYQAVLRGLRSNRQPSTVLEPNTFCSRVPPTQLAKIFQKWDVASVFCRQTERQPHAPGGWALLVWFLGTVGGRAAHPVHMLFLNSSVAMDNDRRSVTAAKAVNYTLSSSWSA